MGRSQYGKLAPDGSQYMPTVLAREDFDADALAEEINTAIAGSGTEEDVIIDIITSCDVEQREQISASYKATYGKELSDDLKDELSGAFKKVVKMCMRSPSMNAAKLLYDAMKGCGSDEKTIIEILCSMTNSDILKCKIAYRELLEEKGKDADDNSLEEWIKSELGGKLERICVALLQGSRNEPSEDCLAAAFVGDMSQIIDQEKAAEQAQRLYDAGEDKWGTDEDVFISILVKQSCWQLAMINEEYSRISEKGLLNAIESEFGGDEELALKTLLQCALDRPRFYAGQLNKAMSGLGTDDDALIYLIVSRSDLDLESIKMVYENIYGEALTTAIRGETSGDYKKILLRLCGENDSEE